MSSELIEISAADGGTFDAYLSLPTHTPAPGIIMLHEIFGVTGWIKDTADMFAERGFCVLAPEMFWRLQPNFTADFAVPEEREQGLRHKAELNHELAVSDIDIAIDHLKALPECSGKVGVTGFCTGGTMAYLAATRLNPDAAAIFYGTQIHEYLDEASNISCPAIFHMGTQDDHVPSDLATKLEAALGGISHAKIHTYEAGHAFAHIERDDHYVEEAALKAHSLTFELFDQLK
tara:strand:+ start:10270 stop:10968 length:699 start_codon:yes stop_codon:yes gene_type:complete